MMDALVVFHDRAMTMMKRANRREKGANSMYASLSARFARVALDEYFDCVERALSAPLLLTAPKAAGKEGE